MLVRATKDIVGYGPITRIKEDTVCVVYAVENINGRETYYVVPYGYSVDNSGYNSEIDPLFFDSADFELINDKLSSRWKVDVVESALGKHAIKSFEEWFENDFYIRAHDWSLEAEDYIIFNRYRREYEKVYKSTVDAL